MSGASSLSSSSSSFSSARKFNSRPLLEAFDQRCFFHGDSDAIVYHHPSSFEEEAVCFTEIREASLQLAYQVYWRFGSEVDYLLLYLRDETVAEAVSMIASLRLGIPIVPLPTADDISTHENQNRRDRESNLPPDHFGIQRLVTMIQHLRGDGGGEGKTKQNREDRASGTRFVAIVECDSAEQVDNDPIVQALEKHANVHNCLYLNKRGDLWHPMDVSQSLPSPTPAAPSVGPPHVSPPDKRHDYLYVLFTSGTSGGAPKAVVGCHQSTWNRVEWFGQNYCSSSPSVVVARRTKLTFVDSITELWTGLLYGRLYTFSNGELENEGLKVILETPCTHVTMLPSQLAQLLRYLEHEQNREDRHPTNETHHKTNGRTNTSKERARTTHYSLQVVVISGEAASPFVVENFHRYFSSRTVTLLNLYGQTESTGDVLCANLTTMTHPIVQGVVSVGQPILPHLIHIRSTSSHDSNTTDTPTEHGGELVVRGNLSHGYLHALFPSREQEFYTGDVGFCHEGAWYIRGRKNDGVKLCGVWTQPTEVEAVFQKVWGNVDCVATILGDAVTDLAVYVLVQDDTVVQSFTREAMRHRHGIPWHLIPKRVFYGIIPQGQGGGAGKVNRLQVKTLIQELLATETVESGSTSSVGTMPLSPRGKEILSTIQRVLGSGRFTVDESKSFIECGGDSALAITLLYELKDLTGKSHSLQPSTHTILSSPSLRQLAHQLADARSNLNTSACAKGKPTSNKDGRPLDNDDENDGADNIMPPKKKKACSYDSHTAGSIPRGTVQVVGNNHNHTFVQFEACVDASPLYAHESLYGACQAGLVQRISNISGNTAAVPKVTAVYQLPEGYRIQADPIAVECHSRDDGMQEDTSLYEGRQQNQRECRRLVIVCGYHPSRNTSVVVALHPDLQEHWVAVWDNGLIKTSPLLVSEDVGGVNEKDKPLLAVVAGPHLVLLSVSDGTIRNSVPLPSSTESRPVLVRQHSSIDDKTVSGGDVCWIVIAFSDWDVGVAIVRVSVGSGRVYVVAESIVVAPVYADLVVVSSITCEADIVICDVLGQVHVLPFSEMMILRDQDKEQEGGDDKIRTTKLSSKPIFSTPQVLLGGDGKGSAKLLLGSHDGWLRCIEVDDLTLVCDFNFHGVIYASPVVVCGGPEKSGVSAEKLRSVAQDGELDCFVLTTAGDVWTQKGSISGTTNTTPTKRFHVEGEIWSDPVLVDNNLLCFGARDSRLHMIRIR